MSNEREISIVDLLWRILFGWRFVLALAVICTIIGGLVSYNKYNNAKQTYIGDTVSVTLNEDEMAQLNIAAQLVSDAENLKSYLSDSALIQADPYNLKVATVSFFIDAGEATDAVKGLYKVKLQSEELSAVLGTIMGISETKYVSELVSFEDEKITLKTGQEFPMALTINIICPDGNDGNVVADAVVTYIESIKSDVEDATCNHEIKLAFKEYKTVVDRDLANKQVSEITLLDRVKSDADNAFKELSAKQLAYYEANKAGDTKPVTVATPAPSFSKKYVALGFVLGLFLACAWIACKAIFASRLQNREELESQYHIRMLGAYDSLKKYRGLDKLFYKWRHSGEKKLTEEERTDIICSNIAILCEKAERKAVSITGTCICEANRKLFESIVGELKNRGLEAEVEENIVYNTSALKNVTKSGAAVLVEQVDLSKYKEIEQELITLKGNDIAVIGCVGIE